MTQSKARRLPLVSLATLAAAVAALTLATGAFATHGGLHDFERVYVTDLSGAAVVDESGTPALGDPDGSGQATVSVHPSPEVESSMCWWIDVHNIGEPTVAHLHAGVEGTTGPVVATLDPFHADEATCIKHDDPAVIQAIINNPSAFYVDVHTDEFPDGALRGQLPPLDCMLRVSSPMATGPAGDVTLTADEVLSVFGDFLPDSQVLLEFRRGDGTLALTVTVASDADGEFTYVHQFSAGDEGVWLIQGRVDGTDCVDRADVTVTAGAGDGRGGSTGPPTLPDTAIAGDRPVGPSLGVVAVAIIAAIWAAGGGRQRLQGLMRAWR
jgi:hypothetical protein